MSATIYQVCMAIIKIKQNITLYLGNTEKAFDLENVAIFNSLKTEGYYGKLNKSWENMTTVLAIICPDKDTDEIKLGKGVRQQTLKIFSGNELGWG